MVYCTKQQEICQESQRSDVATGNARWPSQTQTQTQRCGALSSHSQRLSETFQACCPFESIFLDLDLGSKLLRQDSEMNLPKGSVSDLPFSLKKSWGAGRGGLSQDCALSVTDPSQKVISEPFVRQVQVPMFAVTLAP